MKVTLTVNVPLVLASYAYDQATDVFQPIERRFPTYMSRLPGDDSHPIYAHSYAALMVETYGIGGAVQQIALRQQYGIGKRDVSHERGPIPTEPLGPQHDGIWPIRTLDGLLTMVSGSEYR